MIWFPSIRIMLREGLYLRRSVLLAYSNIYSGPTPYLALRYWTEFGNADPALGFRRSRYEHSLFHGRMTGVVYGMNRITQFPQ